MVDGDMDNMMFEMGAATDGDPANLDFGNMSSVSKQADETDM
jgi:hypothetical protein